MWKDPDILASEIRNIYQNLRAITSIMIHKVWSQVARKNAIEKGSPASAHMAPGQVT